MSRNQTYFILFLGLVAALLGALGTFLKVDDPRLLQAAFIAVAALIGALTSALMSGGAPRPSRNKKDAARNVQMKAALQTYYRVLSEEVNRIVHASNSYDEAIGSQQQKMKKATSLSDINEVVKVVTSELHGMRTTNKKLRSRLDEATHTIEEQRENIHRLAKEAHVDSLTGLLNRRQFDIRHHELQRIFITSGKPYGLLLIDVDHFKQVNDTHGHQAGDAVLRTLSQLLPDEIRQNDFVARYGGEEFAVLLQDITQSRLSEVAEKIRLAVANTHFEYEGTHIPLTVSSGGVMVQKGRKEKMMLKLADKALYKSKQRGRNTVTTAADLGS